MNSSIDSDFQPSSVEQAIEVLTIAGYDRESIHRFAKAAKSWATKDDQAWTIWKQVEEKTNAQ